MGAAERRRGPKPKGPSKPLVKSAVPDPPSGLTASEKAHWKRLVALMAEAGTIALLDRDILQMYVEKWSEREEAEAELKKPKSKGGLGRVILASNGYLQPSPWVAISANATIQLRGMMATLGLTPSARSKLALPEPEEVDDKWLEP